ncbi:hypothetical protein NKH77_47360 [Streptomyces sp. M19]
MTERIYGAGLVLTGPAGESLADGAVRVDGTSVVDVGPREEVVARAAPGTPVTRFERGALLPGLVDAHVHLAFDDRDEDPVGALRAAGAPALALGAAGRRGGCWTAGHHRAGSGRPGPGGGGGAGRGGGRCAAGPADPGRRGAVTVPGGHCWFLGGEARGRRACGTWSAPTSRAAPT